MAARAVGSAWAFWLVLLGGLLVLPARGRAQAGGEPSLAVPLDYNAPAPDRRWTHYVVPAGTLTLSNVVVWSLSLVALDEHPSLESIGRNFKYGFQFDDDHFSTNFLAHPYQGSIYYGSARAFGLTFWESTPYTVLGSLQWEYFGEAARPSLNDLIATSLGGIALGEILYRLSNEVLDNTTRGFERGVRETVAGVLSPANAFYRLTSGRMWRQGRPPLRRIPVKLEARLGAQLYGENLPEWDGLGPNLGVGLDLRYGGLAAAGETVGPFELFTLLADVRLFNDNYGASVSGEGTLWGWKWSLGAVPAGSAGCQDCPSTLLSLAQSYEYQNLPLFDYGAMALGVANHWGFQPGKGMELVAGVRVEGVPLGAVSSIFPNRTGRDYTLGAGWRAGIDAYCDLARWGRISLDNGQTLLTIIDGADGKELFGWVRLGYTLPVRRGFGVGAAAAFFFRVARYDRRPDWVGHSEIYQLYAAYLI